MISWEFAVVLKFFLFCVFFSFVFTNLFNYSWAQAQVVVLSPLLLLLLVLLEKHLHEKLLVKQTSPLGTTFQTCWLWESVGVSYCYFPIFWAQERSLIEFPRGYQLLLDLQKKTSPPSSLLAFIPSVVGIKLGLNESRIGWFHLWNSRSFQANLFERAIGSVNL